MEKRNKDEKEEKKKKEKFDIRNYDGYKYEESPWNDGMV